MKTFQHLENTFDRKPQIFLSIYNQYNAIFYIMYNICIFLVRSKSGIFHFEEGGVMHLLLFSLSLSQLNTKLNRENKCMFVEKFLKFRRRDWILEFWALVWCTLQNAINTNVPYIRIYIVASNQSQNHFNWFYNETSVHMYVCITWALIRCLLKWNHVCP